MSWLRRLLGRQTENARPTSASRRPLYIPYDAPKRAEADPGAAADKLAELRLLEDSQLSDKNVDGDSFDPYNTGAFNRSRSWDKISKHRSR